EKTEVRVGLREFGPKTESELVLRHGTGHVAATLQRSTHQQVNVRAVRRRLLENGQRLVQAVERDQCLSQPDTDIQEGGLESQGVVVGGDRICALALVFEDLAQETVGLAQIAIDREGGLELRPGLVLSALLQQRARQKVIGARV